ncbi:MAG TPA: Nif3-like dinuclear metal center hexameric protein [Longimicrobiales bacterium]
MKAAGVPTAEIAAYLDEYLQIASIRDWKNALNGLQVANSGSVHRVAAAVDASEQTIDAAIERGCDLLLVHHGLFWAGNRPVTGSRYRRLRALIAHDVAVYGAHLPLDVHPDVGNNALLARALGLVPSGTFASHEGRDIGITATCDRTRADLVSALERELGGAVRLIAGGPERVRRVGVLTGSGGSAIGEAVAADLDTLITGEGSHHTFVDAMEEGLNVLYGGHYATETFGVRALAALLRDRFGLEWDFIDAPSGM